MWPSSRSPNTSPHPKRSERQVSTEAGNKTAEDAITNLSRYTTIRGMIVRLDDK